MVPTWLNFLNHGSARASPSRPNRLPVVTTQTHMISVNSPPLSTLPDATGVTYATQPCGWGNVPSGSIPNNVYMLAVRSQG